MDIQFSLSPSFIEQMRKLPAAAMKRTTEFLGKFMQNPTSSGINYEIIRDSHKGCLHSVRIDQDYRGIVGRPAKNAYLLLWVGKHDDAYNWARGRGCEVNALTGALQVFRVEETVHTSTASPSTYADSKFPSSSGAKASSKADGLFSAFSDKELLRIGVPEPLLPRLRGLLTDDEFESALPEFPSEISDSLYMMAAGAYFNDVLDTLEYKEIPEPVDTADIAKALQRVESQRAFRVVENEQELLEILSASMEQWRIFLHPSQRRLIAKDWNGPVRVLGGAGTGKTVAAMHRVKWLLEYRFIKEDERILFTTFTKNLANDIEHSLNHLIPGLSKRVDVIHLDGWLGRHLKQSHPSLKLHYWKSGDSHWQSALSDADPALGLNQEFYRDEWEQVIQAQGIETESNYLKARRTGRGTSLTAVQRKSVWQVFRGYQERLLAHHLVESEDAMRLVSTQLAGTSQQLYASVVVDEAQDLGYQAFTLLRAIAGPQRSNDIFIVGDAHQRIYGKQATLSKCGINVVGRSRKLRVNYRTTEEIRKAAVALLNQGSDDLDGGTDNNKGYHSLMHGPVPEKVVVKDFAQEKAYLINYVRQNVDSESGSSICFVTRTNELRNQLEAAFSEAGVNHQIIDSDHRIKPGGGVCLATMHRVKGLEFDRVIIAGAGQQSLPVPVGYDQVSKERWENQEKALLYVSMTRARREVVWMQS